MGRTLPTPLVATSRPEVLDEVLTFGHALDRLLVSSRGVVARDRDGTRHHSMGGEPDGNAALTQSRGHLDPGSSDGPASEVTGRMVGLTQAQALGPEPDVDVAQRDFHCPPRIVTQQLLEHGTDDEPRTAQTVKRLHAGIMADLPRLTDTVRLAPGQLETLVDMLPLVGVNKEGASPSPLRRRLSTARAAGGWSHGRSTCPVRAAGTRQPTLLGDAHTDQLWHSRAPHAAVTETAKKGGEPPPAKGLSGFASPEQTLVDLVPRHLRTARGACDRPQPRGSWTRDRVQHDSE